MVKDAYLTKCVSPKEISICETNPAPVFKISIDGTILYCNESAKLLVGDDSDSPNIKSVFPVMTKEYLQQLSNEKVTQLEVEHNARVYLFTFKYSSTDIIFYGSDITQRIRLQAKYDSEVALYKVMLNTIPAMMNVKDIDFKYLIANESFCKTVGQSLESLKGKTDYDVFPIGKADIIRKDDMESIENDKTVLKHEEYFKDNQGINRWISTTKVPIHDSQGLVSGIVSLIQDVTELHQSREQLVQSDKLAAIGTLAAGVAHEINNPIGFINSNLNTMSKYIKKIKKYFEENDISIDDDLKDIIEDFQDAIEESSEGTNRVKKIVVDLKSFSRVDKAEKESVNLNDGIETTLGIVWNELKYNCKVEKDYGDIPDLYCYPNQINQVFMNMFVNASHAIYEKSGVINLKTWADQKNIYVSIKDNGKGIEPDNLTKIFEPFFTTKEVGKGTGLGLSLAFDIIKKHKGTIGVTSKVGEGTEFIICLPLIGIENEQT